MTAPARFIVFLAGLLGAAGVAAAALAAHGGYGENLRTASTFALVQAALAVGLCWRAPGRVAIAAAGLALVGALLFCGDLALRAVAGHGMFPMAAPTGGFLMIAGWLATSCAALFEKRLK